MVSPVLESDRQPWGWGAALTSFTLLVCLGVRIGVVSPIDGVVRYTPGSPAQWDCCTSRPLHSVSGVGVFWVS